MPESASSASKPAQQGVQGLAMLAPFVGTPLCLHALGGAFFMGAGIAATLVPIAPAAVPILGALASKSDLGAITEKLFGRGSTPKNQPSVVAGPVTINDGISQAAAEGTV
ncbi:MAG: hypothetical protein A3K90_04495 [Pelodictyon luteolum]|uniref:Uncharacterized protein n=1 Tax=Pelodictyon luteolum TaxID=1100 RepID=A0A165MCF1_PELLU|nr:hypothetical protein [Pelodictyon luteolum]KZK75078.1 MAG: hypothetical protein A3K90_04495 [Pelodictyon luteolum]